MRKGKPTSSLPLGGVLGPQENSECHEGQRVQAANGVIEFLGLREIPMQEAEALETARGHARGPELLQDRGRGGHDHVV